MILLDVLLLRVIQQCVPCKLPATSYSGSVLAEKVTVTGVLKDFIKKVHS